MQDFAAIDFETANNERSLVGSVGAIIVLDEETANKYYSLLIKPEPKYYNYWFSQMITTSMPSLRTMDMTSRTAIMPWLMRKRVQL